MLAGKEGKIFRIEEDEVGGFFRCDGEKAVVATTSPGRFAGIAETLWNIRGREAILLQLPVTNSDNEPRAGIDIEVEKHVMGVSVWKFHAIRDRLGNMLLGGPVTILSGDVVKADGVRVYEKPENEDEALHQARLLVNKPHFIVSAVTCAKLDFDGLDGRVDVWSAWGAVPVLPEAKDGDWEKSCVRMVPGGFDFLRFATLRQSKIGCRREGDSLMPDERSSLSLEGVDWQSGAELWSRDERKRVIGGMIYAPRRAIKRLLTSR